MSVNQTSKRIGIAIELHWHLPWHLDCFQGVIDYGQERGWECVTDPYLAGIRGDHDLSSYDGMVGRINQTMAQRVKASKLPGVSLVYGVDLHSVRSNEEDSARLASNHLVSCGYRRLGFVASTVSKSDVIEKIFDVFREASVSAGCPQPIRTAFVSDALCEESRFVAARQAIAEWIERQDKPLGLYVEDATTARYMTQICKQLEIRVPEDIGIVVRSSNKLAATSIAPTLSEISPDYWRQGYEAASVLDRLMHGENVEPKVRYISQPRVIIRESSDQFISDDELVSQAMRYIAEHCRHPLQSEIVARAINVSRRTLDRRFEGVLGKTVSQEIQRARLQQIEVSLVESDLSMAKIAELFEFGSASQFTQFFKNHTGMTPGAYRRQYQAGDR